MLTEKSLCSHLSSELSLFMSLMPICYTVCSQQAALGAEKGNHGVVPTILLQLCSLCLPIPVKHLLFHRRQSHFSGRDFGCSHWYATTPQPGPEVSGRRTLTL